ncbi:MAG: hypothetical protein V1672_00270 [Candidatus Diapherotrites archaeon]
MISEVRRKFIHIGIGSVFVLMVFFLGTINSLMILFPIYIIGLISSFLILKGVRIPFAHALLDDVQRTDEKHLPGKGALYFFLGANLVLALFWWNQLFVLAALCTVVFGDGFATMVGIKFGKHTLISGKSVEGTLACIIACVIFLHVLFPFSIYRIGFTAFVATAVELLPLNDNLGMPLATAATLLLLI